MRKNGILFLIIVLLLITACSSNAEKIVISQSGKGQEKIIVYKLQKDATLQQQTKKDVIATFNDTSDTIIFINAIKESEKISGTVNTDSPNYEVTFQKDGTKDSYYLWINHNDPTSNAMYVNKDDTHTAYKISVNSTNSINKLLERIKD
ncbi:hypothetical protein ASL14_18870 [Paenibacillus sp. IHB B 3084]|uniref:hypothetical protein n=1 Tax=Paenibacillus sp. IHB B 3084 TaxID=867076 RepID=UPI00071F504D|nr:hypothetical protein [Paenibacillus sp. IHB B 3084]ALP37937.1 hypothetical protein ASL14_18870 [Paenibacillus sp. IHB B 3084]